MLAATYVLPLRSSEPQEELAPYLGWLATVVDQVIVVDGSPPGVFDAHRALWPAEVVHVPVDPQRRTRMGKVGGVLTGLDRARHDEVVIADDDVRWSEEQLREALGRLTEVEVVRPQNRFVPARADGALPWHARWDTGRVLLARMRGGDWPGTMVVRRSALPDGYCGDALFENLELVRTVIAGGGREHVALDLIVDRLPPESGRFLEQRVRQAYDELARPAHLVPELAVLPVLLLGGRRAALGLFVGSIGLAEAGRRRAGGHRAFPPSAALWAPLWVGERAVCSWLAAVTWLRGGVRYRGERLRLAAHSVEDLRTRTGLSPVQAGSGAG